MSFETDSEQRDRKIRNMITDTSMIITSNEDPCINEFSNILKKLWKHSNCWIAGGSILNYFTQSGLWTYPSKKTRDIDVFFSNREEYSRLRDYFKSDRDSVISYENDNSCTISDNGIKYDLIKIHSESPEVCIANFDIVASCIAISKMGIHYHKNFFEDLSSMRISKVIDSNELSLSRISKYKEKGFINGF